MEFSHGENSRSPENTPETTAKSCEVIFSGEDSRSSGEILTASRGCSGEISEELGFAAPARVGNLPESEPDNSGDASTTSCSAVFSGEESTSSGEIPVVELGFAAPASFDDGELPDSDDSSTRSCEVLFSGEESRISVELGFVSPASGDFPASPPADSDDSSTTASRSAIFSGEDSRSPGETLTSSSGSSGEISEAEVRPVVELGFATPESISGDSSTAISGSSGEIPVGFVAPASVSGEIPPVLRERCVGRQERVSWGFTSVIGRREEMEDAVAVVPGFMTCTCGHVGGCTAVPGARSGAVEGPVHFFGVYDGHGGSEVANYCAEKMHEVIAEEWNDERIVGYEWQKKWKEALTSGFKRADDQVITEAVASEMVGSTAVVAVVSSCQIILSNCGDSRAVLCRRTQTIPLTVDHKPDRADELSRIEGEGGKVINWKGARVFGVLAMSRAIGDRYMSPYIIPVPEVTFMTRSDEDECLILASDGLWDVLSNDEVGEVARRLLRRSRRAPATTGGISPAQVVANKLTQLAIKGCSSDNISIIVIDLKSRRQHQPVE